MVDPWRLLFRDCQHQIKRARNWWSASLASLRPLCTIANLNILKMPSKIRISPCSICDKRVTRCHDAILCDQCELWCHLSCQDGKFCLKYIYLIYMYKMIQLNQYIQFKFIIKTGIMHWLNHSWAVCYHAWRILLTWLKVGLWVLHTRDMAIYRSTLAPWSNQIIYLCVFQIVGYKKLSLWLSLGSFYCKLFNND